MRKTPVLLAAGASLALGAFIALSPAAGLAAKPEPTSPKGVTPLATLQSPHVLTRGSNKSFWTQGQMVDAVSKTYTFVAADEMDATSFTLISSVSPAGGQFSGTAYIDWQPSNGVAHGFPIDVSTAGTGTTQLQFNPPIQIRAGDVLYFYPTAATPGLTSANWEVAINGTLPGAAKTNAVVAY